VLRARRSGIPEEANRAAAKAQEHASTTARLGAVAACLIAVFLAVAVKGPIPSTHKPAIGAVSNNVASCGIKAGPADADKDDQHKQVSHIKINNNQYQLFHLHRTSAPLPELWCLPSVCSTPVVANEMQELAEGKYYRSCQRSARALQSTGGGGGGGRQKAKKNKKKKARFVECN
jgi:hypothetical protein